ncbi:hypothetical protein C0995_010806 [Termitomyces sp. Mi166|nr:hypothetical protein C0995_010806 [Termitomyces sp. Mi166\
MSICCLKKEYVNFENVFSKVSFDSLPEHKQWDYMIKLVPDTEPSSCKVYSLAPQEHGTWADHDKKAATAAARKAAQKKRERRRKSKKTSEEDNLHAGGVDEDNKSALHCVDENDGSAPHHVDRDNRSAPPHGHLKSAYFSEY